MDDKEESATTGITIPKRVNAELGEMCSSGVLELDAWLNEHSPEEIIQAVRVRIEKKLERAREIEKSRIKEKKERIEKLITQLNNVSEEKFRLTTE